MTIFIDMDDTIVATKYYFLLLALKLFKKDLIPEKIEPYLENDKKLDKEGFSDYIFEALKDKSRQKAHFIKMNIFNDIDFWINTPPLAEARDVLRILNKEHKIYITTAGIGITTAALEWKVNAIKKYFDFLNPKFQLIYIWDRSLLKGDLLIEDLPFQIKNFDGKTILINYEYNKNANPDFRANNWKEILEIVRHIETN